MEHWINFGNRIVSSKKIDECVVMQVLPEYGWWIKCTGSKIDKYYIYDKEFDTQEQALASLHNLRRELNTINHYANRFPP